VIPGRRISICGGRTDCGVGLSRDYEDVSEASRVFKQSNVTGMEQIEAAVGAHYSLPGVFPPTPAGKQFSLRYDLSQRLPIRPLNRERPDLLF
jgi:hypothetical protein